MKINTSVLQTYSIGQSQAPVSRENLKTVEVNRFSQARFADLLSVEERRFITQNFKTESTAKADAPQLGRFLDIVA